MADKRATYRDRIVVDPEILVGKAVIRGTRISVELVLKRLAQDLDLQGLFEAYPGLTVEDVRAYLEYAQALVEGEDVYLTTVQLSRPRRKSASSSSSTKVLTCPSASFCADLVTM